MNKEDIIRKYFKAWLDRDIEVVKQTFADNVIYSECYGPEYRGIDQIIKWFTDWNEKGRVLEWTVKRTIEQYSTIVVEWYFKCEYNGGTDGFDGVSIVDFDENMRVCKLCEFQSKAEHYFPYEE